MLLIAQIIGIGMGCVVGVILVALNLNVDKSGTRGVNSGSDYRKRTFDSEKGLRKGTITGEVKEMGKRIHQNILLNNHRNNYNGRTNCEVIFSKQVLDDIRSNAGRYRAETGGLLASTSNQKIIDKCYFDVHSQNTHGTFYYDVESMSAVFRGWKAQGYTTNGIYHSHPRGCIRPSYHDISTALLHIRFFKIDYFYLPIIQPDRKGLFQMYFYVVRTDGDDNLTVTLEYVIRAKENGYAYAPFMEWKQVYNVNELDSYRWSIDRKEVAKATNAINVEVKPVSSAAVEGALDIVSANDDNKKVAGTAVVDDTKGEEQNFASKTIFENVTMMPMTTADEIKNMEEETEDYATSIDHTSISEGSDVNGCCQIEDKMENIYQSEGGEESEEKEMSFVNEHIVPVSEYFKKVDSLYPESVLNKVIVCIGTGGARSFLINLARCGFRNFILMDADVVSPSNVATQGVFISEMGRYKVDVIKDSIEDINPEANVICIRSFLDDNISDEEFKSYMDRFLDKKPTDFLILGCTDNFEAQKRSSLLALKYGTPYLAAMMYEAGAAAEIIFVYPGVTESCPRCLLGDRFEKYEHGFKNEVTSAECTIFATEYMNAVKGYIALMLLSYQEGTNCPFSTMLDEVKDRNFVEIRLNPHLKDSSLGITLFDKVFAGASRYTYMGETIWVPQHPDRSEFGTEPCRFCGGTGDLERLKNEWANVDTRSMDFTEKTDVSAKAGNNPGSVNASAEQPNHIDIHI